MPCKHSQGIIHLSRYYLGIGIDTLNKCEYSTAFSTGPWIYFLEWKQYLMSLLIIFILMFYCLTANSPELWNLKWLTAVISVSRCLSQDTELLGPSLRILWGFSQYNRRTAISPEHFLDNQGTERAWSCRLGLLLSSRPTNESLSER